MRTKALILSAAALAAGLLSSNAQVYSANVVGYYNVAVPAGGYALVANQLTNSQNNVNVVLGTGLRSDPNAVNNTVLYLWGGSGYNIYQYFTGADADAWFALSGSTNAWYDTAGNVANAQFNQGTGSFLFNPSSSPVTNTFVGQVPQGNFTRTIKTGFDTYAIFPPVSTNVESALVGFPATSDPNAVNNDTIYIYNGGYNIYQYFTGADADAWFALSGSPNGWYDTAGNLASSKQLVGQGFFLRHFTAPVVWNSSFTVQ